MLKARHGVVAAVAAALAQVAAPALGQQAQKVEKIEVTGSNIKRVDAEGPAPVQVITREEIEKSGVNTLSEVIRTLPANTTSAYDESFTGSFARGSSGVSLRGLGQKSTLTLINGRRMAVYSFAQNLQDTFVDLNSIPLSAIERIEILKDGASAIYGSDAIAGVVNVILRKDYTGAELSLSGGVTSRADGQEVHASGAVGMGTPGKDRYNVMIAGDYFNREAIWARDRPNTSSGDYRRFPGGENLPPSTVGNPGTYLRRPGTNPFPGFTRQPFATCPADRVLFFAGNNNCSEDINVYLTGIPETRRAGLFGRGTFDISPALTAFAELAFNSNDTFTQVAPFATPSSQIGPGLARTINAILPVGHNSNPFDVPIEVRYRFDDVGPRQVINTTDATRFVAGLNGTLRDWSWEAAGGYTRSESEQRDRNNIRISGLLAAIADGSYNFLNNAANSPEVYDRIRTDYSRFGDSKLSFVDAKVSGELLQMRSGPLAMAAGVEYRKEDYDDYSDPVLTSGDVLGRGSTQAKGKRNITSGFVEFNVPVVKDLELQLAGRTDRYSDFGRSSTPKVGVRWNADPTLLVRATYARGFRAPSTPESVESSAFFFQSLEDSTRCAINSVYCGAVSLPGSFSANPDLRPEKSESWTGGFVWEPVRGTSIGIDYYSVKQKDVISSRDFQFILDNEPLYAQFVTRGPATSDDIARGAPGPIVIVAVPYENLSSVQTKGIDVDARIRWSASGLGRFTAGFTGSYLISYKQPPAPDEPLEELAGTYDVPRIKGILSLGHDVGAFSSSVAVNYIHHFKQSVSASATAPENIPSWTTVDAQVAYSGIRNTKLYVGARNLGDKQPPVAIAEISTVYLFDQHNLRGRFWYAGVNYKFR
jgi:iron complex outermembrane receptor protein